MFQDAGYKNIPHSFWQYMTHAGYPQHFGIINIGRKLLRMCHLKNGILIQDWQEWQVDGGYIYGRQADTLYRYEIKSTYYDAWTLPDELKPAQRLLIRGKRLYALFREASIDRLRLYSIP